MNEFYLVDGKLFEVAPNRKDEFLKKYPNAVLKQDQPLKQQGVVQGATALQTQAPSTELNLDDTSLVSQGPKLSFGESVQNSFNNLKEQFGDIVEFWSGDAPGVKLATAAIAEEVFGRKAIQKLENKYGKDAWITSDIGVDEILENIPKYKKEQLERLPTKKIIGSIKDKDYIGALAGGIDAFTNAVGSIAYGVSTLFSGYFFDYTAENYLSYNEELAKRKGVTLRDLVLNGEHEVATPALIGLFQNTLENVGLGKIVSPLVRGVAGKSASKKIVDLISVGGVEALTEWKQYGLGEANKLLGQGVKPVDALQQTILKMFTEEDAYESALQGFVGGTSVRGSKYLLKGSPAVRSTKDTNDIQRNFNALIYNNKVLNETEDQEIRDKAQQNINTAKNNIEILVKKSNDKIETLSEENQQKISEINEQTTEQINKLDELKSQLENNEITKEEYNVYLKTVKDNYNINVLRIKGILKGSATQDTIIDKSINFGYQMGEALGIKSTEYETNKEFAQAIGKTEAEVKNIGGAYINGEIYFNKQAASDTFQINIGAHEILHPILNSQLGDAKQQGKIVEGVKSRLTSRQRSEMDSIMEQRGYGIESGKYNTEYFNVMSDALAKNELSLDKTILERIADFIKQLFKQYDMEVGFANADQVYNFLAEYNKSAQEGKVSDKVINAISKVKLNRELKKKKEGQYSKEEAFDYEAANKAVNDLVGPKDDKGNYTVTKKEYDSSSIADVYAAIIDGNQIDPLIRRGFGTMKSNVYGKSMEFFIERVKGELLNTITKFNPEINNSLMGFINSELFYHKGKISREFKAQQTKSIDIMAGEVGSVIEPGVDEDFSEFDTMRGDQEINVDKINMANVLGIKNESKKAINKNINEIRINQLTFSTVPFLDEAIDALAERYSVARNKIENPKDNLSTAELTSAQKLIFTFIEEHIKGLPKYTSVKADADYGVQGKSVRIPSKIIQDQRFGLDLYVPYMEGTGRVEDAQGNPLYTLPENAYESTEFKNRVLKILGMNPDGTQVPFDAKGDKLTGRSPEAQRVKGFMHLAYKNSINTELRLYMKEKGMNPNAINNLGAGRSEYILSQEGDFDIVLPELTKMVFEKSELKRFTKTMFENEDIINNASSIYDISLTKEDVDKLKLYSYDDKSQRWNYDNLLETIKYQKEFLNTLPDVFKDNKGLAKAITGFNGINTLYQNTTDLKISDNVVLVDNNNNVIRDNRIDNVTVTEQDVDNNISTKKLVSNEKLDKNSIDFIDRLNDYIKGQGKINTLNDLRKILNNDNKSYDQKLSAIIKFKDPKVRELNNALFNLITQYKMAFIKEGKNPQEVKNRLLFVLKTTQFDTASLGGINSLANLDVTILKQEPTRYSLENYKTMSNLGKQVVFDILSGKETVLSSQHYKAGFVPTDMLQQTPNITQQESIDNVIKKTDPIEQFSKVTDDVKVTDVTTLEEKMSEILSIKDLRYEKGDIIDTATSIGLSRTRKKIRSIIPPGANDFLGLIYSFLDKGKRGERQLEFFKENLVKPFSVAIMKLNTARQTRSRSFKQFLKDNKGFQKKMNEDSGVPGFTYDQALRAYLYSKGGFTIPGLDDGTLIKLKMAIMKDKELLGYSVALTNIMALPDSSHWVAPDDAWVATTVQQDILKSIDETSRKIYLDEWINNKDKIFSKNNLNKIRATYGSDFVSALKDVLNRMETGRSRPVGNNKVVNSFLNWIRGSVAVTMFFNTRSALLQTISTFNYINFADNNIFKAAASLADTKQWAKDFLYLYNSDYLKERRGGLRTDVNEAEIADAIKKQKGFQSLLGLLLQKGFAFTRAGDAFAISAGGASFYRNRVNTYLKKGETQENAQKKAFSDFQEITEETQQSARADRLSKQQTDIVGRIFLAFQNTPMQYTRLTVKALQDLKARRGNPKEHLSKIIYYVVLQNILFSSLQQGLFSMLFPKDDDPSEEEIERDQNKIATVANNMVDTFLRGTGIYGAVLATGKNFIREFAAQDEKVKEGRGRFGTADLIVEAMQVSPAIGIKGRQLARSLKNYEYNAKYYEKMGLSIENPAVDLVGSTAAFGFNVPLDRAITKVRNVKDALDENTEIWQKIALLGGWNRWNIGFEPDDTLQALRNKKKRKKPSYRKMNTRKYNIRKYN